MKTTVRLAAFALIAVTTMFATSCGGNASKKKAADSATETATEVKGSSFSSADLVGTWTENETGTLSYEFKKDGTGLHINSEDASKNESFKWKMDGDEISIDTESGGYNVFEYIGDNQLENAYRTKFTKK